MLQGKLAIVTGGGQGIGKSISFGLARLGADVVIADINEEAETTIKEIKLETGKTASYIYTDVSQESSVKELWETVQRTLPLPQFLINNSGVAGPMGPTENVSLADWRLSTAINMDGVFLMCKYGVPLIRASGGGSIINIASISARRPLLERASYCAVKAAVHGLTRALALEFGQWNIRVNSVSPGAVDGKRQRDILKHAAQAQHKKLEEVTAQKMAASPLNTFVTPSAIADAVAFLCSPAGAMITGQDINVSAGAFMG